MIFFKPREFFCCDACTLGYSNMNESLLDRLDHARAASNVPYILTSTIRCKRHNVNIGGRVNSAHLTGNAVDISAIRSNAKHAIVRGLIEVGFNRIGIYETFIHADNDKTKTAGVIWLGSK